MQTILMVVCPKLICGKTLFWSNLLCCIGKIHCTVHRDCLKNVFYLYQSSSKALKVKEATFLLVSDEYQCFKGNPLPIYELLHHANCPVAHILEPQTFSNLHSAESEQLKQRKTGQ